MSNRYQKCWSQSCLQSCLWPVLERLWSLARLPGVDREHSLVHRMGVPRAWQSCMVSPTIASHMRMTATGIGAATFIIEAANLVGRGNWGATRPHTKLWCRCQEGTLHWLNSCLHFRVRVTLEGAILGWVRRTEAQLASSCCLGVARETHSV